MILNPLAAFVHACNVDHGETVLDDGTSVAACPIHAALGGGFADLMVGALRILRKVIHQVVDMFYTPPLYFTGDNLMTFRLLRVPRLGGSQDDVTEYAKAYLEGIAAYDKWVGDLLADVGELQRQGSVPSTARATLRSRLGEFPRGTPGPPSDPYLMQSLGILLTILGSSAAGERITLRDSLNECLLRADRKAADLFDLMISVRQLTVTPPRTPVTVRMPSRRLGPQGSARSAAITPGSGGPVVVPTLAECIGMLGQQ